MSLAALGLLVGSIAPGGFFVERADVTAPGGERFENVALLNGRLVGSKAVPPVFQNDTPKLVLSVTRVADSVETFRQTLGTHQTGFSTDVYREIGEVDASDGRYMVDRGTYRLVGDTFVELEPVGSADARDFDLARGFLVRLDPYSQPEPGWTPPRQFSGAVKIYPESVAMGWISFIEPSFFDDRPTIDTTFSEQAVRTIAFDVEGDLLAVVKVSNRTPGGCTLRLVLEHVDYVPYTSIALDGRLLLAESAVTAPTLCDFVQSDDIEEIESVDRDTALLVPGGITNVNGIELGLEPIAAFRRPGKPWRARSLLAPPGDPFERGRSSAVAIRGSAVIAGFLPDAGALIVYRPDDELGLAWAETVRLPPPPTGQWDPQTLVTDGLAVAYVSDDGRHVAVLTPALFADGFE